ncbi:glutaminase A [Methyloceanibacter sp.]|uniref:glutaminase A n=1 Tax=Methyloceanibacter sp. TaxID=1965321 RepID=UPI00351BA8B8
MGSGLDDIAGAARIGEGRTAGALAPVEDYLAELHARIAKVADGKPADYIPELGKADPNLFGIAIATVDGAVYAVGDANVPFTIQSVSKPFMYGYALQHYGREAVLKHVGVEPTGEAFNSIVLDEVANRPFNPMVNAGAIAVAELMQGATQDERIENMLTLFSSLAGRELAIDACVYRSELATGHRNRAIAYMMLNFGMITRDPNEVLDLYFRQCSVSVTCRDLAIMAATLANDGRNPLTHEAVLDAEYVRDMLSVMNSCGMYDYAGEWAYEVGMPAKSGVSGCIIAVIPGQIGISVYSPPIDSQGNSGRGIAVCQEISDAFELHAFNNRTNVRSVIRRDYRADLVRSNRLRTPQERKILAEEGRKIAVVEAQGALFFGSTEQLLRRLAQLASDSRYIVVDFKRVHLADSASRRLIRRAARSMAGGPAELVFVSLAPEGPLGPLARDLAASEEQHRARVFSDVDAALEWCEDQLLADSPYNVSQPKFAISELDLFKSLTPKECHMVEGIVQPLQFEKGDVIIREGADANFLFVLARGKVSVQIRVPGQGGRRKRVASIGPGLSFGKMALLDGGKRSADIVADERVICYGFRVEQFQALAAEHPNIMITILGNLTREFSERLRHANEAIGVLE